MKDGKPWEAFGVMGGGMQPQGHVQVLTNQIDFGLNVQEAGDASRWQHESSPWYRLCVASRVQASQRYPLERIQSGVC